jgi:hypothetical protein
MKNLIIFVILLGIKTTYAQSFINIDIGNSLLLRPNLGYEYRWKNKAIGGNIRWQRNAHIWVTEWPGLMKTNGLNLDLMYRYFYKKYVYTETGLRLTSFTAPFLVNGWHTSSLHNSDRKLEPFIKIGLNINKNKKIQWDLGVGVGRIISTKNLFVNDSELMDAQLMPYTENQLKELYKKPKGVEYNWAPHAQLRLHFRIKK